MPTADLLRFLDAAYSTAPVERAVGALLERIAPPAEFAHASIGDALASLVSGGAS